MAKQFARLINPVLAVALVASLALSLTPPLAPSAEATHVTPTLILGTASRTCASFNPLWLGDLKVDPNGDGTFTSTDGKLTVTITNTQNDKTFDWFVNFGVNPSSQPVVSVYVKAGSAGSNLYVYDPPASSDTGLTSPGVGTTNQISHISFCYIPGKANPTITTQVSASSITLGQPVTDTANLSGSSGAVTGTVTFFVCGPSQSAAACTSGGTQVGTAVTISSGAATSSAFIPSQAGAYCFRAEYTPAQGSPYAAGSHTNNTNECFTANLATPTITTQVSASSITVGQSVTDTANLSGSSGAVTGTVTFFVCGPDQSATACTSGGAQVGSAVTITSGAATSSAFQPSSAGAYCFRAQYTPAQGSPYAAGSHTNNTNECFTATPPSEGPAPNITTQVSASTITLGQSVTDTASLSGSSGAVTGTVTFFVCGPSQSATACTSGGAQVGSAVTISSGAATSSGFTPSSAGAYCFRAEYTPAQGSPYAAGSHTNNTNECFVAENVVTAQTATLRINKVLSPSSDPGRFNLQVDGATAGTGANVGNDGTTGDVTVAAGSHTVGETAAGSTSLANYTTTINCGAGNLAITDTGTSRSSTVSLAAGSTTTCTITNSRVVITTTSGGVPPPPPPPPPPSSPPAPPPPPPAPPAGGVLGEVAVAPPPAPPPAAPPAAPPPAGGVLGEVEEAVEVEEAPIVAEVLEDLAERLPRTGSPIPTQPIGILGALITSLGLALRMYGRRKH